MKNPFEILGCSKDSSPEDITKNYKKLAMKFHPDRNSHTDPIIKKEMEEQFKEINCAFTYLKKNNFKYSVPLDDFKDYSTMFNKEFFKTNIDIGSIFNNIRNIKLDNIADNIIKGINNIQNIYNKGDESLLKTDNICINANIELFDIYNNVQKEISLKINKKCKECMALGYNINNKQKCQKCLGKKIIETDTKITFKSMFKTVKISGGSHEDIKRRPGNIYINIFCKPHNTFRIIDNFNILYKFTLSKLDLANNKKIVNHKLHYLDLNYYNITISNIDVAQSQLYEFKIDDYGLYVPNKDRGNLIIEMFDPLNLLNTTKPSSLVDTKDTHENHETQKNKVIFSLMSEL